MDPILVTTIAALPVGMISFELFRVSRSSRRNRQERCGRCGGPLYAPNAAVGPSLMEGHLVCEPCASKGRRALTRSLIAAVGTTGATVLALAAVAVWAPSELGFIRSRGCYGLDVSTDLRWRDRLDETSQSSRCAASRSTTATGVGYLERCHFQGRAPWSRGASSRANAYRTLKPTRNPWRSHDSIRNFRSRRGYLLPSGCRTHAGKVGVVRDIHTSKTGHVTITVEQGDGVRFKTLAKNVVATKGS